MTTPYNAEMRILIANDDGYLAPGIAALIQIDPETVGKWAEEHELAYTHFRSLAEHPRVRELVQGEVERVNARMPQVQQVRRFHLLTKELDHDDGEVTATMKVKRKSIAEKGHTAADGVDMAGELGAGHEGQRRLELVLAFDDQQVGEVEAGSADGHPHLAGCRLGGRHFAPAQRTHTIERFAEPCMHREGLQGRFRGGGDDTEARRHRRSRR